MITARESMTLNEMGARALGVEERSKVYAEIAPAAPHAMHMPSHIFVQLGMWEGVVASNDASYKAALDHVERKGLKRGRSEYHALQWYHYGQLQLGNKEMARWALDGLLSHLPNGCIWTPPALAELDES